MFITNSYHLHIILTQIYQANHRGRRPRGLACEIRSARSLGGRVATAGRSVRSPRSRSEAAEAQVVRRPIAFGIWEIAKSSTERRGGCYVNMYIDILYTYIYIYRMYSVYTVSMKIYKSSYIFRCFEGKTALSIIFRQPMKFPSHSKKPHHDTSGGSSASKCQQLFVDLISSGGFLSVIWSSFWEPKKSPGFCLFK